MPRPLLASAVLLIATLAFVPRAQADFALGNEEVGGGPSLLLSGFGMDSAGNSIVSWSQRTPGDLWEGWARRVAVTGELGPPIELSAEPAFSPVVAMTPSGRAFVAWSSKPKDFDPSSVVGRWVEADGSLGPQLTLATAGPALNAVELHVVVDPAGVATVSWKNEADDKLAMRRVRPDSIPGPLVEDVSGGPVTRHAIAALPDGGTAAVWQGTLSEIRENVVSGASAIGTPSTISAVKPNAWPALTVDGAGNGLAVWREDENQLSVRGRLLASSGEPLGGELIIDTDKPEFLDTEVQVAADSENDFLVTWSRQDAEGDSIVYARGTSAGGLFAGPAQPLSSDVLDGQVQQAALLDAGIGPVVWVSQGGTESNVLGRSVDATGAPTGETRQLLTDAIGPNLVASAPQAGVAAFAMPHLNEAVVRRFLVPPACTDSEATVVQGRPIATPLACTGPGIEGEQVIDPPEHGEVTTLKAGQSFEYTPTPGFEGTDSFAYTASNDGGGSNVARVTVKVGRDTVRPRITSFRFVPAERKLPASGSAKKSRGRLYRFRLRISEPARARARVERHIRGVRRGRRCRKAGKGTPGKRCAFYRSIGAVSSGTARRSVTLTAPRALAKRLAAGGRFRAIAIATDPARNKSKPKRLKFRVKRRRRS